MGSDNLMSNTKVVKIDEVISFNVNFHFFSIQVQSTAKTQRIAAHSHVKGLGLHAETKEALQEVLVVLDYF